MWADVGGEHARGAVVGEVEEEEQPAAQDWVEHEADRDGQLHRGLHEGPDEEARGRGASRGRGRRRRREEELGRGRREEELWVGDGGGVMGWGEELGVEENQEEDRSEVRMSELPEASKSV